MIRISLYQHQLVVSVMYNDIPKCRTTRITKGLKEGLDDQWETLVVSGLIKLVSS